MAKPTRCWPWAHMWTAWRKTSTIHGPVYPHPDDGKKRMVLKTHNHRRCLKCGKVQEYLYDCQTHEA